MHPRSLRKIESGFNFHNLPTFDILFTSDHSKKLNLMEKYEDLNSCKVKYDMILKMNLKATQNEMLKNEAQAKLQQMASNEAKLMNQTTNEQINNTNDTSKSAIKDTIINDSKNNSVEKKPKVSISFANKNPRGRPQTRAKNNSQFKVCKNEIAYSKMKENDNIKKIETRNTLEYFLNETNNNTINTQNNLFANQSRLNDNLSNVQTETVNMYDSKVNESILSKEIELNNELNINVFNSHIVPFNNKIPNTHKKRITLKDYMLYLEKSRRSTVHQNILHKIISKLNN